MTEEQPICSRNPWLWRSAFLALALLYLWLQLLTPLRHEPFGPGLHGNDFKHIFLGAWMLPRGMDPYDAHEILGMARMRGFGAVNPYVYLPFTGLALSPLALLDPGDAMRAWFVLNHCFLLAALVLICASLRLRPNAMNLTALTALVAFSGPVYRTLTAGQLNCALLLLYSLVFVLVRRKHTVAAGIVAAFAFLFKITPGILLAYFLFSAFLNRRRDGDSEPEFRPGLSSARRHIRAAAAMVVASLLFLAGCVAWVGIGQHVAFGPLLADMGYGKSTWAGLGQHYHRDAANQSFNSLFHHLFSADGETQPWVEAGPGVANGLTRLAFLACVALVLWRTALGRGALRPDMLFALFILLSLLAPSLYWDHYATIALWPLLACYARLPERLRPSAVAVFLLIAGPLSLLPLVPPWLAFAVPALGVGFASGVARMRWGKGGPSAAAWGIAAGLMLARFPFDAPAWRSGAGLLAMSLVLWGTLILFALCLTHVRRPSPVHSPPNSSSKEE